MSCVSVDEMEWLKPGLVSERYEPVCSVDRP